MGDTRTNEGSAAEVFGAFLVLGLTAFGGPVAHLGYFREAFVERRRWLSEAAYAELVALAQFLPGPASSQVGMALGLARAGPAGMLAAWLAFTLPSALLMVGFAHGLSLAGDGLTGGWVTGLKLAAVAVVAQAVLGMARGLAPDRQRATVAVAAMVAALLLPRAWGQLAVIAAGALIGLAWLRPEPAGDGRQGLDLRLPRWVAWTALASFFVLLFALPLLAERLGGAASLADAFYRAGALVFGGGHVVLPLLEAWVVEPGMVERDAFLAGYGAAQALPGPLFSFAAFLGALNQQQPTGLAGATVALVAIFLPSALLVVGALPFWSRLRNVAAARKALLGVNAAVVGLLAAVLYDPVFISVVDSGLTLSFAAVAYLALAAWRLPPWLVVIASALTGSLLL